MAVRRQTIVYVTSSEYKKIENGIFEKNAVMSDGTPVRDLFQFEIRPLQIKEVLEIDIGAMVNAEVVEAYAQIKVPCIVEHAGLIFEGHVSYPGGLTKPMWNALGKAFVSETRSADRKAIARATVAYCDGQSVRTFIGEATGRIADKPRGSHEFYWDTVFIPDLKETKLAGKTYAEIADEPGFGLEYKVLELSQSSRAMLQFLEYRRSHVPWLWRGI
jgi:inosine/xanthosine triphosphate pyrophosphatase family protein